MPRTTASGWAPASPERLKRAGGDEIEQEAMAIGGIPLGTAVATTAGRLRARWVDPRRGHGTGPADRRDLVVRTTRACLEVADELGCRSLALPAFGTGVGGFPLGECARIMVDEARIFPAESLERVIFAVYGSEAYEAFSSGALLAGSDGS